MPALVPTPNPHPALEAARKSWRFVQERRKRDWLALLADNVVIEDPIGASPLDPSGAGVRGRAAAEAFWDRTIARASIAIETHESFAAGLESAHLLTLRTRFPDGSGLTVRGIFTYALNDAGKIRALRGYWSLDGASRV
ncbi:MAG: nuclear transport factor 2 family protein [Myxococcota bacterium]